MDQQALKDWLRDNPSVTDDAAAVTAIQAQHQVPTPLSTSTVIGMLSPASVGNLAKNPNTSEVVKSITAQDRGAVGLWAQAFAAAGEITPTEAEAIITHLLTSQVDPAWATLQASDVAAARAALANETAIGELRSKAADGYNRVVTPVDLTGATVTMTIMSAGATVLTQAGIVTVPAGSGQTVTVDLTAAQTGTLIFSSYSYALRAMLASGHEKILVEGLVSVGP